MTLAEEYILIGDFFELYAYDDTYNLIEDTPATISMVESVVCNFFSYVGGTIELSTKKSSSSNVTYTIYDSNGDVIGTVTDSGYITIAPRTKYTIKATKPGISSIDIVVSLKAQIVPKKNTFLIKG